MTVAMTTRRVGGADDQILLHNASAEYMQVAARGGVEQPASTVEATASLEVTQFLASGMMSEKLDGQSFKYVHQSELQMLSVKTKRVLPHAPRLRSRPRIPHSPTAIHSAPYRGATRHG